MIKSRYILLLLLLIPFFGNSQTNITIGRPYGVIDAANKFYFHRDNEILTVKIDKKMIVLQKLDAEQLKFEKIEVYEDFPRDYVLEEVMEFNGRYFLFFSLWDRDEETEQLFYREIDFNEGAFMGKPIRLVQVKNKISGTFIKTGFYKFDVVDKFDFQLSYDQSKLLIQYRLKPEIRSDAKSYDVIGVSIFDKNLNALWNKELKMPYTEKKMNILDYSIDSEGNTFILSTVYNDNTTDIKKKKNDDANYHIELLRVKANSSDVSITPVKLEDKFINSLWIYESPFGYMICTGFYNNGDDLGAADGILLFNIGKEGEIFDLASYEIPIDILNQYVKNKSQKKNKKNEEEDKAEFEELELRKLLVDEDGGILLIGEQHYVKVHTRYSGNGRMSTYYTYHYNDMLVTKINNQGKLAWMKKLPKRQTGGGGKGGMSYEYMYNDNNHYLLFLDNKKNMELPLNQVPAGHLDGNGGFLTAYKIKDSSGEVSKISILDTKDIKGMEVYQFRTNRIVPLNANEFVFEVYKKKKEDVLIKVEMDN